MSAYMVESDHIDGLLSWGLFAGRRYGPLRWFAPGMEAEYEDGGFQEGEPWGPRAVEIAEKYRRELTEETAGAVGAMLLAENRRSIDHRYAEEELEQPYVFKRYPVDDLSALIVLKAISCLRYQSCEHPGWERSEASAFCDALEQHTIGTLPGYSEAAGWELPPNRYRRRVA